MLEQGSAVAGVAERLQRSERWVRRVREAFDELGLEGLHERKRPGRPPKHSAELRCELIAMACGKPSDFGVQHRVTWTYGVLRDTLAERVPEAADVSRSWVVKTLLNADLRPHRTQLWLHSPDPAFREKVNEVCALYASAPENSVVLCVDEKTGIQALGRKHPVRDPAPGRARRMDYEYVRNGTRGLIAAFDAHSGQVYGEMRARRTADDLVEFMEGVAAAYPDGDVHIVWDNLNIHHDGPSKRWTRFNARHGGRFHFHYTPIHASWVNQIELYFSILSRRVLRNAVFDSTDEVDEAVLGFIEYWNREEAMAFDWKFKGYPVTVGTKEQPRAAVVA